MSEDEEVSRSKSRRLSRRTLMRLGLLAIPKTMRAVGYRGVNHLRVKTVPVPWIQSDEMLVKVAVCGALVVPIVCDPKDSEDGEIVAV